MGHGVYEHEINVCSRNILHLPAQNGRVRRSRPCWCFPFTVCSFTWVCSWTVDIKSTCSQVCTREANRRHTKKKNVGNVDNEWTNSLSQRLTKSYLFAGPQLSYQNNQVTLDHPSYSPDFVPCNFYLFPKLKLAMKGEIWEHCKPSNKHDLMVPSTRRRRLSKYWSHCTQGSKCKNFLTGSLHSDN